MKKIILTVAALLMVVLLWGARKTPEPKLWQRYEVGVGDTLWSIAKDITPDVTDCRVTVKLIADRNGIIDSLIFPGQELTVPVWEVD